MNLLPSNLPPPRQQQLRRLLDSDGFDVLVEVLESKAFEDECNAANHIIKATTGHEGEAKESARKANAIHEVVDMLKKMRDSDDQFTVAIAKPTTNEPSTK